MDSEEKDTEQGHGDSFHGDPSIPYIDIHVNNIHVEEDSKKKTRKKILPIFNHHQLKTKIFQVKRIQDHFSMDEILKSLQYVIDGGGEDAEVSNTFNLCEDDIGESNREANSTS